MSDGRHKLVVTWVRASRLVIERAEVRLGATGLGFGSRRQGLVPNWLRVTRGKVRVGATRVVLWFSGETLWVGLV